MSTRSVLTQEEIQFLMRGPSGPQVGACAYAHLINLGIVPHLPTKGKTTLPSGQRRIALPWKTLGIYAAVCLTLLGIGILPPYPSGPPSLILSLLLLKGLLGIALIHRQGPRVGTRIRRNLRLGFVPNSQTMESFLLLTAGAIVCMPSLLSSVIGLFLLFPPVRARLILLIRAKLQHWLRRHPSFPSSCRFP